MKFIKWVIILILVGAASILAVPFLMFSNWLSPHETEVFARKFGVYLQHRIKEDFR